MVKAMVKAVVLNGSPKGDLSVTLQYARFLEQQIPLIDLEILNIGATIKQILKDPESTYQKIASADLIFWVTPVYYFLVPAQLKLFIETLFSHRKNGLFENKYCAIITTSIHFFDHTANCYLREISEDLGLRVIDHYPAETHDLLDPKQRENFLIWGKNVFKTVQNRQAVNRITTPLKDQGVHYKGHAVNQKEHLKGKKMLILTDQEKDDKNLTRMVRQLEQSFQDKVTVHNIRKIDIKGGCLGCMKCGHKNQCVYQDEYQDFYRNKVMTADIVVFAGTIRDRFLSSAWKQFFDRAFFMNHAPTLMNKGVIWIISGNYSTVVAEIIQGYTEVQNSIDLGVITDQHPDQKQISENIEGVAARVARWIDTPYTRPKQFPGVGGHKLFRDAVWNGLKLVFPMDHKAYKRLNMYDFPRKTIGSKIKLALLSFALMLPPIRKKVSKNLKKMMVQPYLKIVNKFSQK